MLLRGTQHLSEPESSSSKTILFRWKSISPPKLLIFFCCEPKSIPVRNTQPSSSSVRRAPSPPWQADSPRGLDDLHCCHGLFHRGPGDFHRCDERFHRSLGGLHWSDGRLHSSFARFHRANGRLQSIFGGFHSSFGRFHRRNGRLHRSDGNVIFPECWRSGTAGSFHCSVVDLKAAMLTSRRPMECSNARMLVASDALAVDIGRMEASRPPCCHPDAKKRFARMRWQSTTQR